MLTKELLLKTAKRIHNPKTGKYLKLCKGALVTGAGKSRMHCAIGELYHAATGKEPNGILTGDAIDKLNGPHAKWSELNDITIVNDDADRYEVRARRVAKKMRELAESM